MGVRFVVGRAGSGRSRHCFDAIVSAMRSDPLGPAIYWILPKQATFSAERELTTLSGLDAFCRARILSFELLGEEVLTGCGGAAVPQISAIGRQMLLGHLLRSRAADLAYFNGVARQPGLAARLDSAFAELERCGHDPEELDRVIDELGNDGADPQSASDDGGLGRKLRDFRLLYTAYRKVLGEERVDPHRRLEQVLDCIKDHAPLRGASIYIDDFRQFSAGQRRMIIALARCAASVDITLLIDPASPTLGNPHHLPDDLSLFHLTETEYRRLALDLQSAGIVIEPRMALKEIRRTKSPALRAVERMFDSAVEPQPRTSGVEFIEAPDRRSEMDAVARRIRQGLAQGLRLRQIAVLMRDIDDYAPLLAASFAEHGIPYFVDRRKTAFHHPLLQFTRSAMRIARSRWRDRDAILSLLKSGLAGFSRTQVDELENYVLLHRIDGPAFADAKPWIYDRKPRRDVEDDGEDANVAPRIDPSPMDGLRRRIALPLGRFINAISAQPPPAVGQLSAAVFRLLSDFDVRKTLAAWIEQAEADNEPELRGEHEQVWTAFCELFDQIIDLLGDVPMDLDDFIEILDVGLERFDLAIPPPTVDQVLVGTVDRTRTPALHTVFVLGLCEGQFPRIAREDPMLNDAERDMLRSRELMDLDPASTPKQLDERLLGYIGFSSASDRLIVSRARSHEDKPANPSSFWHALRRLFPANEVAEAPRMGNSDVQSIGTPRQLVTSLMRWARHPQEHKADDVAFAALYDFLVRHDHAEDPIGRMRARAWPALSYRNAPALSAEIANEIYRRGLTASVTRIEAFAACPFKHFARYTLRLEPRDRPEVSSMDLGTVYHGILERVVKRVLKEKANWCDIPPAASRLMIEQFAREVGQTLREQIMLSTARNHYLLEHIERTLDYVCAAQQAVLKRGKFRPAFAELHFGMEDRPDSLPPLVLKTPRGRELRLQGKIDRVDLDAEAMRVAVIDYKMRSRTLSLSHVYYGLSLQLLSYLLVLDACGEKLFKAKVAPVAAFYAQLLRHFESIEHPQGAIDTSDEQFNLRIKPRGIFDFAAIGQIDQSLAVGRSQVVQCQIKKDGNLADPGKSDAADSDAFKALLGYVEAQIKKLADQMIDGEISPRPYRMGNVSPCSSCDYRSVCRFDPAINSYLTCPPMRRDKVLEKVMEGGAS